MNYIKLQEVCDVRDGTHDSPSYIQTSGYPLVTSKNIIDGRIDLSDVNYIAEEDYTAINKRSNVDTGDIIMPMIGTIGNPVIVGDFCDFAIKNVSLIKPKSPNIIIEFVYYLLKSDTFIRFVKSKNRGGTQKFISLNDIRNIDVPIIPLSEQIESVTLLKKAEHLIKLHRHELQTLDELIKARFVEMFDKRNDGFLTIGGICSELMAGGDRPKETSDLQTDEFPYPVYANAATNNGLLCYAKNYTIDKPCVTIAARGCTVGFTAIRYEKFTPVVRLISMVPNESINPVYLKYYMDIKMTVEGNGAAQPQLTIPMIKTMAIKVPPLEVQEEFENFVQQVDKSKVVVQKALDEAQTLFDSLMQQYFG